MTITAVSMVRDEADIIGYTIEHLLAHGVDRLIIADNLSTDDTRLILDKYPEVTVVEDSNPAYNQSEKMTSLAFRAWQEGADWVLPFDADELFYPARGTLADFFAACTADVVEATVWDHIATDDDPPDLNPFRRITHRRQHSQQFAKVAFRAHPDAELHMGNHDVNRPGTRTGGLYSRHFQYRSFEHMRHKVRVGTAAYQASDLPPQYGTHWKQLGVLANSELFAEWRRLCKEDGLVQDPAPWKHG